MLRNVENEKFGLGQRIFQSVLPGDRRAARRDRAPPEGREARSSTTSPRASIRRCATSSASSTGTSACATDSSGSTRPRSPTPTSVRWQAQRRRLDRVVAVLEPLALRRHHRRAERPPPRVAGVSRLRLDAVGDAQPARRAQGRGALEPGRARRRARTGGSRRARDREPGRHARGPVGRAGRPARRGWARRPRVLHRSARGSVADGARGDRAARAARDRRRPSGLREPRLARARRA